MRGPIIYCLEGVDNGGEVRNLFVPPQVQFTAEYRPDLLGGVTDRSRLGCGLVRSKDGGVEQKTVELVAVPYCVNANRGPAEMAVWLPESPTQEGRIAVQADQVVGRVSRDHRRMYRRREP